VLLIPAFISVGRYRLTNLLPYFADIEGPILRVALYTRVSTEEQREGQTIDSQVSELERFARQKYWRIVGTYKDEAWSGALLARPQLDRLRDDASKGLFDAVLINDVDRLARDVSHLGIVKRALERSGVQVIFKKLPTEQGPTSNLMVNILGSFAEFERELIADRTRRGRRHKIEVRQQYLGGNTSFGYCYTPRDKTEDREGRLEITPQEAIIVKQMFDWVGREGLSARRVAERLSERKVTPRKHGPRWGKSSVLRILRNEMYAGVWHYNKYESCEPAGPVNAGDYKHSLRSSLRRRDKSEWLPVRLPKALQIVKRELWERVQQQLDRNITFSPRNSKHSYLLKGLVKCGGCGARYVGDPCHGKFYYRCLARCKRVPTVRESVLDLAVWQAITEAILNPSIIIDQIKKLQELRSKKNEERKGEMVVIDNAVREIEKEEERILEAYRLEVLSSDQLGKELEKLKSRRDLVELRRLTFTKESNARREVSAPSIIDFCTQAANRLSSFSTDEKQQFLRLIIEDVIFNRGQIRIRGVIPVSDQPAEFPSKESEKLLSHSRTATMTAYPSERSSVTINGFELAKFLPEAAQLKDKLTPEFLRRLLQHVPRATLAQYSDKLRTEYSIVASTTAVCRAFKRAGLDHNARSQLRRSLQQAA
jgi:site-specific DNA recombinase